MQHLEQSAKHISDRHLHQQIRAKEPSLNITQVDFSNDLDVLLSEIVALLDWPKRDYGLTLQPRHKVKKLRFDLTDSA